MGIRVGRFRRVSLVLLVILAMFPALGWAAPVSAPRPSDAPGLPLVQPWFGDFEAMRKRRIVRILVPYSRTLFFVDRGRRVGVAAELGRRFEDWLNKRYRTGKLRMQVVFVPTRRDRILPALAAGLGDIAAANLTVTEERAALVAFAPPWSDKVSEILVTGPSSPKLSGLDDLAGREVHVRHASSYAGHLEALARDFEKRGLPALRIVPLDERLEDEDVLEMTRAGLLPYAVVDSHKAEIWTRILSGLEARSDLAIASGQSIAWAFRKESPQLSAVLTAFVATHREGTAIGNDIRQRYFRDDRLLKNAYASDATQRFSSLEAMFRAQGQMQGFDWLMLAAQGFQESQLDQSRRSRRGAVGVMQLMPATAASKPIEIKGVDSDAALNIQAGATYLRHLVRTYINDPGLTERDRTLFAFAAYNAGPGNLRKFRRTAASQGLDPNVWFDNVEHAASQIVGAETVDYVANIYKYYVAYRMLQDRLAAPCTGPSAAAQPREKETTVVAVATTKAGCEARP